jgi:hypothetical protein
MTELTQKIQKTAADIRGELAEHKKAHKAIEVKEGKLALGPTGHNANVQHAKAHHMANK